MYAAGKILLLSVYHVLSHSGGRSLSELRGSGQAW